jgi:hypothetical protein
VNSVAVVVFAVNIACLPGDGWHKKPAFYNLQVARDTRSWVSALGHLLLTVVQCSLVLTASDRAPGNGVTTLGTYC